MFISFKSYARNKAPRPNTPKMVIGVANESVAAGDLLTYTESGGITTVGDTYWTTTIGAATQTATYNGNSTSTIWEVK